MPSVDVVAAAYELSARLPEADRRSLVAGWSGVDIPGQIALRRLPLGDDHAWSISRARSKTAPEESISAVLPAWSADSTFSMDEHALYGTEPVLRPLARLLAAAGSTWPVATTQVCKASYTREGFEAAAIMYALAGGVPAPAKDPRIAQVRFTRPYAVVAVASVEDSPWDGVPVFSGWITEPDDPEPGAAERP